MTEYDVMGEFIKHIREMGDGEVYNFPSLYFNVFQDSKVIEGCEMLLVAIAKSDPLKANNALHNLYDLVQSLTEKHVLPTWEEDMKKEADIDAAITKYEMQGE